MSSKQHKRLLWKQAQNVRHPERSWSSIDLDSELRNIEDYMFIAVIGDVGNTYMISSILRKHKYYQIVPKWALSSGKRLCGRWFIN